MESAPPSGKPRGVEAYNLLTPKFVDFKAADGTTTLQGMILLPPPGGPMMANGKAPLIVNPYGGPGSADHTQCLDRAATCSTRFWRARDLPFCTSTIAAWLIAARPSRCPSNTTSVPIELSDQLASREAGAGTVSPTRWQPHWLLGMELRRILHALCAGKLRHLQRRRFGGAGDRLAQL